MLPDLLCVNWNVGIVLARDVGVSARRDGGEVQADGQHDSSSFTTTKSGTSPVVIVAPAAACTSRPGSAARSWPQAQHRRW
ncbi:hypothetical protein [Pseudonocardia sp. MH-G8]|uniref:hypothetical protein n=1 Tax=Pseudonocardia sp. MH-G8 TaxID=1854588 RepID=UPI00117A7D54|nr:hypothetical protein [Pseudonocardia sp. MH-G8]